MEINWQRPLGCAVVPPSVQLTYAHVTGDRIRCDLSGKKLCWLAMKVNSNIHLHWLKSMINKWILDFLLPILRHFQEERVKKKNTTGHFAHRGAAMLVCCQVNLWCFLQNCWRVVVCVCQAQTPNMHRLFPWSLCQESRSPSFTKTPLQRKLLVHACRCVPAPKGAPIFKKNWQSYRTWQTYV